MKTINLRDYYPVYTEDTFVEVSDEVAAFFAEDKRRQTNYAQYIRYHKAFYSLDRGDGIETAVLRSASIRTSSGRSFSAMLCQIFLQYIQYCCKNLSAPDEKNPLPSAARLDTEQVLTPLLPGRRRRRG